MYRSLAKKGPWAVHLTLGSNWGVGQHLSYQYCVLLSAQSNAINAWHCGLSTLYTSVNHCAAVYLHVVVCANQSHHTSGSLDSGKSLYRWALFQISFRPQQEILEDGRIIHSGPSFARLQYIWTMQKAEPQVLKIAHISQWGCLMTWLYNLHWPAGKVESIGSIFVLLV